ncbi:MAG: histidine kinase dimerization/phosphoacceptor domain -containing protein [Bacteroidota bacterium]
MMRRKLGLLGLILCSVVLCLQAQSTDSLIRYWNESINEVRATSEADVAAAFIDEAIQSTLNDTVVGHLHLVSVDLVYDDPNLYEDALLSASKAINVFESLNDKEKIVEALTLRMSLFYHFEQFDSATFYLNQIEQLCHQQNDTTGVAAVERKRGAIFNAQYDYANAQIYYYKALRLYETVGDKNGIFTCLYNLGDLTYFCCQNYEEAKNYYEKALKVYPNISNIPGILSTRILNQLGKIAEVSVPIDLEAGLQYHYQALEILEEKQKLAVPKRLHGDIASTYRLIADNLMFQKNYKKALEVFEFACQAYVEPESDQYFSFLIAIGEAKAKLRRYEEAIQDAEKGRAVFIAQHDIFYIWYANKVLSDIYEQKGDYETALFYYKTYKSYSDSLLDGEKISSMRVVELNYTYEKQRALDSLEARNEQLALANELGQYKSSRNYLGIILVLVLFGAGVIYWLYYKRNQANLQLQNTNQALQEQTEIIAQQNVDLATKNQENEVLLKEIHHRVKNNLQTISSLLSMQSATLTEEKAQVAIMQSQSRVQSIALIHQKLYQRDQLMGIEIKSYLDTLIQNLHNIFTIDSQRIVFHFSGENLIFHLDAALPIALIINELLTNSFKYAFPNEARGNVYLDLQQIDKTILIQYSDDGIGIAKSKNTKGFGTRLVNLLCMQLNGTIERLKTEKGVAYQLEVKKYRLVT